jgi:hypothetical protein
MSTTTRVVNSASNRVYAPLAATQRGSRPTLSDATVSGLRRWVQRGARWRAKTCSDVQVASSARRANFIAECM